MTASVELDQRAKSTERGIAVLYFVAGGFLAMRWTEWGEHRLLAMGLGVSLVAMGVGLLARMRWARWITLGTSFLAMLGAFATPVWLTMYRPFDEFQPADPGRFQLMTCAFAATFGWLGYQGLGYLRSAGARAVYEVESESSFSVVASALLVGSALLGVHLVRDGGLHTLSPPGIAPAAGPTETQLPDLKLLDLCQQGEALVQAAVVNQGKGWSPRKFTIEYDNLNFSPGKGHSVAPVPHPGQVEFVALDRAINPAEEESSQLRVQIVLNSNGDVRESTRANNVTNTTINFRYFYPELRPCDSVTINQP